MSSFELYLRDKVLYIKFGSDVADNDQITREVCEQLSSLELPRGPLLGIFGPCSLPAAYAIANHVQPLYDAIAVFDPKIHAYVVIQGHAGSYALGDRVNPSDLTDHVCKNPLKVVLCGPPHTGKSCLKEGLKEAILSRHRTSTTVEYPYVLTACPDGEGAWYAALASRDMEEARKLKEKYKQGFTPSFAQQQAAYIEAISLPLTIIDVGGRITDENEAIMQPATHAVILWRRDKAEQLQEWLRFCEKLDLPILAILESDHGGTEDSIEANEPVLKGSIHSLERGQDCSNRPTVIALAELLIQACIEPPKTVHAVSKTVATSYPDHYHFESTVILK
jgi:CRISPR-associated protein Csx3